MSSEPRPRRNRVVAALGSQLAGRLIVMALTFLSTGLMARLLNPADFGVMAAAMLVISLTNAVFDGAFGIGIIQKAEVSDDYVATTFNMSLLLAVIMFLLIAACSPLVEGFFRFKGLALVLIATATTLIFKSIGSVSRSLLARRHKFHTLAVSSVATYFIGYCLVSPVLALSGFGVWALVGGAVAAGFTEAAVNFFTARVPFRLTLRPSLMRDVVHTSGLFTATHVLNWAANTAANAVVGRSLGAGPLGLYSRGAKLLEIATSATAEPMQRVLLPAFARLQGDIPAARAAFDRALSVSVPIFGVVSVLLVLHAKAIVLITLGPKWMGTVAVAQILFSAMVPRCSYKISESLSFGLGRSGAAAIRQGVFAVMMIGGAIVGAPYGPAGVALAASLAITGFYAMSIVFAAGLVGMTVRAAIEIHGRAAALAAVVGVADFGVATLARPLGFWPSELAGGATALVVCILLLALLPPSWIGADLADFRRGVRRRILAMFPRSLQVGGKP